MFGSLRTSRYITLTQGCYKLELLHELETLSKLEILGQGKFVMKYYCALLDHLYIQATI